MDIPNVIGFTLAEAKKILREAGLKVLNIRTTASPRCKSLEYEDYFRVLKYTVDSDGNVELTVCKF